MGAIALVGMEPTLLIEHRAVGSREEELGLVRVPGHFVDVEGQPIGQRQAVFGGAQIDS
jgi:hypothetical protein